MPQERQLERVGGASVLHLHLVLVVLVVLVVLAVLVVLVVLVALVAPVIVL